MSQLLTLFHKFRMTLLIS